MTQNRQLDPTDIKILSILQQDARMQVSVIAGLVHKTRTPTVSRIHRLQRLGYIERFVAVLNRKLLGRTVMMMALVKLKEHGSGTLRDFADHCTAQPEVMVCLHLSGEYDFILQVAVADPTAYEVFLTGQLCCLSVVDKVHSSLVLREYKMDTQIQLAGE